jgi:osmoprotectant transport system permease protein
MSFVLAVAGWLADPVHWQGTDGIPTRMGEHLALSATALLIAMLVALPCGLAAGHSGRGAPAVINVANLGRAIPSLALLALCLPISFALGLGLGFWPTMFALVPLGVPPILINAVVAMRSVERDVVEVAHSMGMSDWQVLFRVELPLAAPIVIAGVRNAAVSIVATATLGAIVASGGLGRYIVDGLARQEEERLFAGAALVAAVAVLTELGFGLFERIVVSTGVRAGQGDRGSAEIANSPR